jgi:hypothetical protein
VVLTVRKLTFTLTTPDLLAGGASATGTVTLSGPAPAGGITVQLTSSVPSVLAVPATVQLAAGATSATFPITTVGVAGDTTVNVSATIGSVTHTNTITVRAARLTSLTLNPTNVLNLNTTLCTLTMDGPAPAAGYTVTLTNSNKLIANVPTSVKVPAGKTSFSFTISTMRVTRTLTTNITASGPNGGSGSAVLTVHN